MRRIWIRAVWRLALICSGASLLQIPTCDRLVNREFEVLLQPQSSPTLIRQSFLVNLFGPRILSLF